MYTIPFNIPFNVSSDIITNSLKSNLKFSGDGPWTKKCHEWFFKNLNAENLLTTSCTHALEIMALLIDIQPGDEVIMPSYTFVSTANAFAIRGAKIIFVDIRPDTMNIDENCIEMAITNKTKAIVVVHYAGVSCEMDKIKKISDAHNLFLLEDAAQGMMSTYNDIPLGTIGHLGTYSFHETKNYHCGEGGLLIINDKKLLKNAEIIREKGTDRSSFLRGEVDKYTWQMIGSSYLPSEFNAMYLHSQLYLVEEINNHRLNLWNTYYQGLRPLAETSLIELPGLGDGCKHNAHLFYIKLESIDVRNSFINFMKSHSIQVVTHYIPLHTSPAGKKFSTFIGEDRFTTREAERLIRLPLFYGLKREEAEFVVSMVHKFFKQ